MGYWFNVTVLGGYQSQSIILTAPDGTPVPYGGQPSGPWDTLLIPDTDYGLSAILNCDLTADNFATITGMVRFWWFEGGVGTVGHLISEKPISIDFFHAGSFSFPVQSPHPFHSAPNEGEHRCVAVSISNLNIEWISINADVHLNEDIHIRCLDPGTAPSAVSNPGDSGSESCTAWRNTDSSFAIMGLNWKFTIGLGSFTNTIAKGAVRLEIHTKHIPRSKYKSLDTIKMAGQDSKKSEFVDLKVDIKGGKHIQTDKVKTIFEVAYENWHHNNYEVTGKLPDVAKHGDIVLVSVTAHFNFSGNTTKQRSVNFLEFLHVVDEYPFVDYKI